MEFDNNLDESLKKFSDSCKKIYGDDLDKIIQSTKDRKEIKKKKYNKVQYLIWLIEQVEGIELKESYMNKDDDWLDKEIEFYEYFLEK